MRSRRRMAFASSRGLSRRAPGTTHSADRILSGIDSEAREDAVLGPDSFVLMHDTAKTARVLAGLVDRIEKRGYRVGLLPPENPATAVAAITASGGRTGGCPAAFDPGAAVLPASRGSGGILAAGLVTASTGCGRRFRPAPDGGRLRADLLRGRPPRGGSGGARPLARGSCALISAELAGASMAGRPRCFDGCHDGAT
jgi:hypothetical protein